MGKPYKSGFRPLRTTLSTGRAAGSGTLYDDYDDESGNPRTIRDRGRVRLPSDGTNPNDLNGPVVVVRKGKGKDGAQ